MGNLKGLIAQVGHKR